MHADFTGTEMDVPQTVNLASYITKFLKGVNNGSHPLTEDALTGASSSLKTLQTRLETLIELEGHQTGSSVQDAEHFASKLLEKLALEKEVIVPSGYSKRPAGHRVYFRFQLEEKNGKEWVQGNVVNVGEGAGESLFLDGDKRERVDPELTLNPVPIEKLPQSLFWKAFLELRKPAQNGGESTEWSIDDFKRLLLSEWPGGIGPYSQKSKKPQYSGTCQFAPLKHIITETFDSKEASAAFLLSLYSEVLVDYITETGVTQDNLYALKETCSHLARRLRAALSDQPSLSASISGKLNTTLQAIEVFETNQKRECLESRVEIYQSERGSWRDAFSLDDARTRRTRETILNPPQGDLKTKLNYYLNQVDNWKINQKEQICFARRALEELPSINDPIWESKEASSIVDILQQISTEFRSKMGLELHSYDGPIHIGPNDAALLMKSYAVQFKVLGKKMGDPALVNFYLSRMKGVLESDSVNLLRPTHPDAFSHLGESVDYLLQEGETLTAADNISLMRIDVRYVSDLKKYPHLNFLYETLKKDAALKQGVLDTLRLNDPEKPSFSDLDCVIYLYSVGGVSTVNDAIPQFKKIHKLWQDFFTVFGIRMGAVSYTHLTLPTILRV